MPHSIDEVSYCLGMNIAKSLIQQNFNEMNPVIIAEAISDIFNNKKTKYTVEESNQMIQDYLESVNERMFLKYKIEGEDFLKNNKVKNTITTTKSGLQFEILKQGNGLKPNSTDTVKVHYHGTLIDGSIFDSSIERGQPATFGVHQVIKGWTEALQLMPVGSKYRLYIPQELAYGTHPHPGGLIKPYMALIFDVELLEIVS